MFRCFCPPLPVTCHGCSAKNNHVVDPLGTNLYVHMLHICDCQELREHTSSISNRITSSTSIYPDGVLFSMYYMYILYLYYVQSSYNFSLWLGHIRFYDRYTICIYTFKEILYIGQRRDTGTHAWTNKRGKSEERKKKPKHCRCCDNSTKKKKGNKRNYV